MGAFKQRLESHTGECVLLEGQLDGVPSCLPPQHLCFSSRVRRTHALSSGRIWSDIIMVSTTRCAMPGSVVCSKSRRAAPGGTVRARDRVLSGKRHPRSLLPQGRHTGG